MCIYFNFYPLIRDKLTGKQHIAFSCPIDFNTYDDMKFLSYKEKQLKFEHLLGKSKRWFNKHDEFVKFVQVPCGHCSECLNNKAKSIAFRIMKELEEHDSSYFITLTYNEDNLPPNNSLVKDEISKFNKKLKVYLKRKGLKSDFRFYGVGEYGGKTNRPHYHVIYFGLELPDLVFYSKTENGDYLYTSEFFSSVWNKGFCVIGSVDIGSACYVARYTEKKQGLTKQQKQLFIDAGLVPEFSVQSMNPGIGSNYLNKVVVSFSNLVYNENIKGSSFSFPKYYTDKVKKILEYDPVLEHYENYVHLANDIKASKWLLAYNAEYNKVSLAIENEKKKNKKKR